MNGIVISCRWKYFVIDTVEVRDGRKIIAGLDRTELLDLLDCVQNGSHVFSF